MYNVGTQAGNANTERQGTGYATVPDSSLIDTALLNRDAERRKQEQLDRQKVLAAHKAMTDFDPEHWYRHDAEVQGLVSQYIDKGGQLTAKQIDPYASTDPESIEFQKFGKKVQAYAEASKQTKEEWSKLQTLYNTKDGRDMIENWDEIAQYYSNPSIVDIVDNKKIPPTPKFRQPLVDSQAVTMNILKGWKASSESEVMSYEQSFDLAKRALENPANTEGAGGGYAGMVRQTYASLPEDDRKAMENRGRRYGVDGLTYFLGNQYRSLQGGTIDFNAKAAEIARQAELSKSSVEDINGTTTTSERYKGGEGPIKEQLRGMLLTWIGQMERDVDNGVYGNLDNTPEENVAAGVEHYYNKVTKPLIPSNYGVSRTNGAGSDKEVEQMSDKWYAAVTQGTQAQKEEAIKYLDKNEMKKFIPNMSNEEAIDVVFPEGNGFMVSVINTKFPDEERKVWVPATVMSKEAMKNSYKETYNRVKRHFATTESGAQQKAQQPAKTSTKTADDL